MPAVATARDAMIWMNSHSLPGDTIRAHSDLPSVVDTDPSSSTYGRRVYLRLRGRKLTNENPITMPHRTTACEPGLNDGTPIVELIPAQDPRTGVWYGGELQGFTVRGGNQEHKSSSRLAVQGQTGIAVNPRYLHADLCAATLCTISEVYHDGYGGPGGTLACTFEWVCRMAQLMHYDGAYMMMGKVDNCHRAYAAEAYGKAVHTIHGVEISDMELSGTPGYWDSPVAAGNGYDFGLRFLRNYSDTGMWTYAGNMNFNGFPSSSVEIAYNRFSNPMDAVKQGKVTPAVDLRQVTGGSIHDNVIPCVGPFASLQNSQHVDVYGNDGGPKMTVQA
jgi:hypothetical protein